MPPVYSKDKIFRNVRVEGDLDAEVQSVDIKDYAVSAIKVASGAITVNKLGSYAVEEAKINTGAVTENKLGTDSASITKIKSSGFVNKDIYVDGARADTYTADGTIIKPYKTVLAALAAINADVGKSWVMHVAEGTYSDNLTITGPRFLRIEGHGAVLSGTILINSGVGSYDRIEFMGVEGLRAEKGPALTLSGKITATRTNDSLIYVDFNGCYITGQFEATTCGTWVLQYRNCRVNGAITGTFAAIDPEETILIETYGFNEFAGAITGKVSFYNCHDADFYSAITTTPWYENRFHHCSFGGAVSIIPQGGASSAVTYLDTISAKSLMGRTPTLTGVTVTFMDYMKGKGADLTAANDMILTLDGSYFDVTGATQINGMLATNILPGTEITLQFDSNPVVKHNTAASAGYASFKLNGAADFSSSADDTLTVVYDGTYWREKSRAVI